MQLKQGDGGSNNDVAVEVGAEHVELHELDHGVNWRVWRPADVVPRWRNCVRLVTVQRSLPWWPTKRQAVKRGSNSRSKVDSRARTRTGNNLQECFKSLSANRPWAKRLLSWPAGVRQKVGGLLLLLLLAAASKHPQAGPALHAMLLDTLSGTLLYRCSWRLPYKTQLRITLAVCASLKRVVHGRMGDFCSHQDSNQASLQHQLPADHE